MGEMQPTVERSNQVILANDVFAIASRDILISSLVHFRGVVGRGKPGGTVKNYLKLCAFIAGMTQFDISCHM